jgi:hypothetical protein
MPSARTGYRVRVRGAQAEKATGGRIATTPVTTISFVSAGLEGGWESGDGVTGVGVAGDGVTGVDGVSGARGVVSAAAVVVEVEPSPHPESERMISPVKSKADLSVNMPRPSDSKELKVGRPKT